MSLILQSTNILVSKGNREINVKYFYLGLNVILSIWILFIGVIFFSLQDLSGYLVALVSLITAGVIQTRRMWSYFAAGGLGVACFQLAKLGFEFSFEPRVSMTAGAFVIPLAIFLSVKLGRTTTDKSPS